MVACVAALMCLAPSDAEAQWRTEYQELRDPLTQAEFQHQDVLLSRRLVAYGVVLGGSASMFGVGFVLFVRNAAFFGGYENAGQRRRTLTGGVWMSVGVIGAAVSVLGLLVAGVRRRRWRRRAWERFRVAPTASVTGSAASGGLAFSGAW